MSLRLFAALPVPEAVAERVLPLMKGVPGAKWRPPENFHITLAFFGEMDEARAEELDLELAQVRVPPFEMRLKGAGHFGKAEPQSLWLGVEAPPELADLARRCRKAANRAGAPVETRNFIPHLTLAYLINPDIARLQKFERRLNLYESAPFTADRFHLYSSWTRRNGPNQYLAEAEYPLAA